MSQRYLIPTNLFYHWADPWPDEDGGGFPVPNTGDIYFNIHSQSLRVFYEGGWHDAGGGGGSGGGGNEVVVQDATPSASSLDLWVDTDAAAGVIAHGDLSGLTENYDHPQYLKTTKLVVTTADPVGAPPGGEINTVWIKY